MYSSEVYYSILNLICHLPLICIDLAVLQELFCQGADEHEGNFKELQVIEFEEGLKNDNINERKKNIPNVIFVDRRVVALNMSNGEFRSNAHCNNKY